MQKRKDASSDPTFQMTSVNFRAFDVEISKVIKSFSHANVRYYHGWVLSTNLYRFVVLYKPEAWPGRGVQWAICTTPPPIHS